MHPVSLCCTTIRNSPDINISFPVPVWYYQLQIKPSPFSCTLLWHPHKCYNTFDLMFQHHNMTHICFHQATKDAQCHYKKKCKNSVTQINNNQKLLLLENLQSWYFERSLVNTLHNSKDGLFFTIEDWFLISFHVVFIVINREKKNKELC